jgi:hypothetical protein
VSRKKREYEDRYEVDEEVEAEDATEFGEEDNDTSDEELEFISFS